MNEEMSELIANFRTGTRVGKELKRRLKNARARLRYHTRRGVGASRTRRPQGEAAGLARADVEQLEKLLDRE